MIYKVSYVVLGGDSPGGIRNEEERPKAGDEVKIGDKTYIVQEVHEIMPPRGNFQFLHATVLPAGETVAVADE